MAKSTTEAPQGTAQHITVDPDHWNAFLADFTRLNRGAHARVDILGPGVGYQVETEDRPFDGIAADNKDGEATVWIHFGSTPDDHLAHGVHNVKTIAVRAPAGKLGAAVLVEARDQTKTVLELTRPENFALPGETQQQRR